MGLFKEGFSKLIENYTKTSTDNELKTFSARVIDIILDENHPKFTEYGEWKSIGTVLITPIKSPIGSEQIIISAKPMFSNIKLYPIKNELVYCLYLPITQSEFKLDENGIYYLPNINIWNNVNLNPLPNPLIESSSDRNIKKYQEVDNGSFNQINKNVPTYSYGNTFIEKRINPLKYYEGDIIYEGRWGQSLRFGSTINNNTPWNGNNSDPITIISNRRQYKNPSYITTLEDINNDDSSVYITSTQKLPINFTSSFNSFKNNSPKSYKEYFEPQIVLISNRLLFISKKDSILFKSNKDIHFDTNNLNIDSKITNIQSKVYLGDKNATEPVLLGNKTIDLLGDFFINLKSFMDVCSKIVSTPTGTPIVQLNTVSKQMSLIINELNSNLKTLKSTNTFTK